MPKDRKSKIWTVIRVSRGNFLEMYDFMVFGYYAAAIGNAFFPSGNPFVSLMLSLMTFGAGFLMRPLGAIVLGAYTDRHGRQQTDRGVSGHARDGATAGHKGFYVSYNGAMVVFLTHVRF